MRWLAIVRRNPFVLPMAVVAGFAIFFISEGSYWQSVETINDLRDIRLARQSLVTLERTLADAETAQRGYLLTARADYLPPQQDSRKQSLELLAVLDGLFAADLDVKAKLVELRALSLAKLDEMDEIIRLVQSDQKATALQLDLSGRGRELMDSVRVLTVHLMNDQNDLRLRANLALDRTLLLSRYGVAALSAVLMVALVLYLRKSADLASIQSTKSAALQADHDRLEADVAQRTSQLTDLTRHLLSAREDERHRLARNLHDDLGALLTAAKLDAARIRSRLGAQAPEAQVLLADLVNKLNSSIALGRSIIEDLRPSTLDHLGLAATLDVLSAEFSQRSGIPVNTRFEPVRLKPSTELVAFRVVQEALTNLSKYAKAKQVWITLVPSPGSPEQVTLSVRDDGAGFAASQNSRSAFGLLGMRFRVQAEGGSLRVQSQLGQGTLVEATLPAQPPAA